MGNIVPRVGFEPTSLAFQGSVLPLNHVSSLMSSQYPFLPVYAAPCLRGQRRLLHSSRWNYKSFNAYNYIHTGNDIYIHGVGSTITQLVQDHGHGNQCHGCDENGKFCA